MSPHDPPWARRRRVRQNDFLVPGEFLTEIVLATNTPPNYAVVRLPRCLISPRFQASYMAIDTVRILSGPSGEYPSREMTADETRMTTFASPLGILTSTQSVCAVFGVQQLSLGWEVVRFPVTNNNLCRKLGINVILGAPFIEWYQTWLTLLHQRRLSLAAAAGPQYTQSPNNERVPNGGGGGQEDGNGDNVNYWMQMQMPLVATADEDIDMEGVVGGPELNDCGQQAHR
ncbi:hypothetical protein QBC36DRAFT_307610 [Triangularia setosa]|uniref:Uncharacterized protein n=1 Tax=Triangularia setosa TaxID=2587417 RepID=A0AAN6WDM0_9PEZI|nr:hypothetical protein QBC36DRAFT_307610 [Podospora setosa]